MSKSTLTPPNISKPELIKLTQKYKISASGTKQDIANGLWSIRSHAMSLTDLEKILPMLSDDNKTLAKKLIHNINTQPITDYKGMWKPLPKPISKMSRKYLVSNLQLFRDAWEKVTTRNQDLDDERLHDATDAELRQLIKFYYSDEAKNMAAYWLHK